MAQIQGTRTTETAPSSPTAPTEEKALAAAAKVWQEVAKNEETRFSNLNTRALGVVTLSGVITTIGGIFAKDLQSSAAFDGGQRFFAAVLLALSLILLVVSIGFAVLGVLLPGGRYVFGGNDMDDATKSKSLGEKEVNKVVHDEYSTIAGRLTARNSAKAVNLQWAYIAVSAGILLIAVAGVVHAYDAIAWGPPIK